MNQLPPHTTNPINTARAGLPLRRAKPSARERKGYRIRGDERCALCCDPLAALFHVDHVLALHNGGTNDPSNLAPTCPSCNQRKGTMLVWDFLLLLESEHKIPSAALQLRRLDAQLSRRLGEPSSQPRTSVLARRRDRAGRILERVLRRTEC
jgi:hypothetical protein